ncbi:MAG TPA: putative 2-aminoethylphosphonate ABC transporter substrate-binding protein [Cyanothece sp. UBA12306]|nr:putative 2-aminoethylphosphonate ABC transporter substrate-binding protein [Cyanothece sp. UBA12306]
MRKTLHNFIRNFISALMVIILVASCTASNNPTTNTNTSNGTTETITVYTALEDDQLNKYLESFKQEQPNINVNIVRDSTGIVTAKLLAEKDNPQADVIWGLAASSLLIADQQGLLEPYTPKGIENVREDFRDSKDPPHWVGIDAWMSAFCVNTIETEKQKLSIPTSWADLSKPVYKGKIVMSNPASSGTGYLSVAALLQLKGEQEGWKYLDALHENIAQYMHSGSKPCKVAGSGEYPIGISFGYRAVKQMNGGEPIKPVFPKEGSGWDIEANALVKKAEIKPAAKTFLDWAISSEIAQQYAENFPLTAVKTNVKIPKGFPEDPFAQLIKNDFQWMSKNREAILEEWTKRYDGKSEPKT